MENTKRPGPAQQPAVNETRQKPPGEAERFGGMLRRQTFPETNQLGLRSLDNQADGFKD